MILLKQFSLHIFAVGRFGYNWLPQFPGFAKDQKVYLHDEHTKNIETH